MHESLEQRVAQVGLDLAYVIDYLELLALIDTRIKPPSIGTGEAMIEALRMTSAYHSNMRGLLQGLEAFCQRLHAVVGVMVADSRQRYISERAASLLKFAVNFHNWSVELMQLDIEAIGERLEWLSADQLSSLVARLADVAEDLDELLVA